MPHARQGRFPQRSSTRRLTAWAAGPRTAAVQTIAANGSFVATTTSELLVPRSTLVRLRGELLLFLVSATAQGDGFEVGFGVCNISQNAAGIGATAIPQPLTDVGWDGWLAYWRGGIFRAGSGLIDDASQMRRVIDSKSMRKAVQTDTLVAVVEVIIQGTASLRWSFTSRVLDKLT